MAEYRRVNVEGTRAVLTAARKVGVPRLVYVSTVQVVLGDRPLVQVDETAPYAERPITPYAASKAEAERLLLADSGGGLATVAVRPTTVWGSGVWGSGDRSGLPELLALARSGRLRWVDGGGHLVSTTHVRNLVEGILAAAERGRGGAAYFVTDGTPVPFREFVGALLATQGVPAPTGAIPRWAAATLAGLAGAMWSVLPLSGRPVVSRGMVRTAGETCTVRDDRARQELGYEGKVTRQQGLAELRRSGARAGEIAG
jgi:nucleoside-diphosphate-sugar epimerase